jgi:hypothetical protein
MADMTNKETLYVHRDVVNGDDIIDWAKSQGLKTMLDPSELHVTICYSNEEFDWSEIDEETDELVVPATDEDDSRKIEMFGKDKNVLVIQFHSDDLLKRHEYFCDQGASYDFDTYKSHITITYDGADLADDHKDIEPYWGEIVLGPEVFAPIKDDFSDNVEEIDLTEAFHTGITVKKEIVEIFKNPTRKEFNACVQYGEIRAFVIGDDLLVWKPMLALHAQVREALKLNRDTAVPIVLSGTFKNDAYATVSDASENTAFWHSPEASWRIQSCGFLRDNFFGIEVSYYDEAIYGDWTELEDEEDEDMLAESRKKVSKIPECWWYNPDRNKFLDCDDEDHAEYVWRHHRKMKLPIRDIAEIIDDGNAMEEFEELAMSEGWARGEESTITAKTVPILHEAVTYFVDRWPGEKVTLELADRWKTEIGADAIDTFLDDLLIPSDVLDESSDGPRPRKFWLVFDIPTTAPWSGEDANRMHDILVGLSTGNMEGVKGISGRREIVTQFLAIARNAALVMDGEAVLQANRLEQIAYHDAEYLLKDNMTVLYRLFMKDSGRPWDNQQLMQTFMDFTCMALHNIDHAQWHQMNYYGFPSKIGDVWKREFAAGKKINSVKDLYSFFESAVEEITSNSDWRVHLEGFTKEYSEENRQKAIRMALTRIGKIYSDEAEWIVKSTVFRVPQNSTLLIAIDQEVFNNYNDWRSGKLDLMYKSESGYEAMQQMFQIIYEFDLNERYDIRFIDGAKFNKVRADISVKRSKKLA